MHSFSTVKYCNDPSYYQHLLEFPQILHFSSNGIILLHKPATKIAPHQTHYLFYIET